MCGIVGVISHENMAQKILEGLKKLEYRGYDSAGIALVVDGAFKTVKQEGKIVNLEKAVKKSDILSFQAFGKEKSLQAKTLIGHTRWATHGRPSQENAHPHASSQVCVVHNGIIENYQELKELLLKTGAKFLSETDSEVIPHLVEYNLQSSKDIKSAIMKTLTQIKGSYALAMIFHGDEEFIAIAKKGSPLLVGFGENENFISSDYYALSDYVNEVVYLNDDEFAFVYDKKVDFFDKNGILIQKDKRLMEVENSKVDKGNYDHFMLKEIFEQPAVLKNTLNNYVDFDNFKIHLPNFAFDFTQINKITIVACGTSYYAGMAAKYLIEEIANVEVEVDIASEFRYRKHPFRDDNLMLFISQSGETADTVAALKYAKEHNQKILSIINVAQSSMAELSTSVIKTVAGVEIGVASTKAYVAQLSVLALLAIKIAEIKKVIDKQGVKEYLLQLNGVSKGFAEILAEKSVQNIKKVAKSLVKSKNILYVGRGLSYVSALEGSLKLRELSYINSQAIAAGELKHGTIALIDKKMSIIAIAPTNILFEKIASNIEEIRARSGQIISISDKKGLQELKNLSVKSIEMPSSEGIISEALLTIVPLQLLAYYVSLFKGNDVDQPRNLAKSVTVE
jgi:glucosamine--fructose-6-phosphate aminotransferase (isomerizing)